VPLSAEFAAQMTLFGAPEAAQPTAAAAPPPPRPEAPAAPVAAFQRREVLRRERTRLVGELHRRGRLGHREINAWLNRAIGVSRVEEATIKQLEQSVRMLVKELGQDWRTAAQAI